MVGQNVFHGSGYCFIGFDKASPRLSENLNDENLFRYWLVFFYYYALNGYTINAALDEACERVGWDYGWADGANVLKNGFSTYWPFSNPPQWAYDNHMKVYGDGYVYMPQW